MNLSGSYHEALNLLARRAHSIAELRIKLLRKGWLKQDVDSTIERLLQERLLNDAEFAIQWVEQRQRVKHLGPERLKRELLNKGIEACLVDEAIDRTFSRLDVKQEAYILARKVVHRWQGLEERTVQRRLIAYLTRRGFTFEQSMQAAETCLTDFFSDS